MAKISKKVASTETTLVVFAETWQFSVKSVSNNVICYASIHYVKIQVKGTVMQII